MDVYLTWGEPLEQVAEKIAEVRRLAAQQGRTVRFGIRLHSIVRETEAEAWAVAEKLIAHLDQDSTATSLQRFANSESVGQQRMTALHNGDRSKLIIAPNLWAGVGLARGGAGTALVGSPENVAARMREYADIGIDTFVMSGYPHLEEAYYLAELVFPLLPLHKPGTQSESLRVDASHMFGDSPQYSQGNQTAKKNGHQDSNGRSTPIPAHSL